MENTIPVTVCSKCGMDLTITDFNAYQTNYRCSACGYVGEVLLDVLEEAVVEELCLNEEEMVDLVNQPSHYMDQEFETIELIEAMLTPEELKGFLKGNIIKYQQRAQLKGTPKIDLDKVDNYTCRLIHGCWLKQFKDLDKTSE